MSLIGGACAVIGQSRRQSVMAGQAHHTPSPNLRSFSSEYPKGHNLNNQNQVDR